MFGHLTYLVFLLAWALPVLAVQWLAGASILWEHRRTLAGVLVVGTVYLVATDAYAIGHHIWFLRPGRILGPRFGVVPLEEALFFLLTNAMVAQSAILVARWRPSSRVGTVVTSMQTLGKGIMRGW